MKKFANRKRAVLALAFFAVSSFALAPGLLRDNPRIAAALQRIQPQLEKPSTQLAPPHILLTPPEPDYRLPALPLQDDPEPHGQPQRDLDIASIDKPAAIGANSLWSDDTAPFGAYGGGYRRNAGAIGGGIAAASSDQSTAAVPQDRDPDAAPGDKQPGAGGAAPDNTELADNDTGEDVPGADDLHNPIPNPEDPAQGGQPSVQVPEPPALLLMAAGVAGLVFCRRRARAA